MLGAFSISTQQCQSSPIPSSSTGNYSHDDSRGDGHSSKWPSKGAAGIITAQKQLVQSLGGMPAGERLPRTCAWQIPASRHLHQHAPSHQMQRSWALCGLWPTCGDTNTTFFLACLFFFFFVYLYLSTHPSVSWSICNLSHDFSRNPSLSLSLSLTLSLSHSLFLSILNLSFSPLFWTYTYMYVQIYIPHMSLSLSLAQPLHLSSDSVSLSIDMYIQT